jgi:hypothetical protein
VGGPRLSLTQMAQRIYEGMRAPSMQQFAEMIVRNWAKVPVQQHLTNQEAARIFLDFVREQVRYRPDPPNTELVKSAAITLCVPGAAMCVPVEDCDGLVVAFLTLCGAYGIPVHIIKQTYGSDDQEHVLGSIQDDDGTWYPADPSAPGKPLGWKAPASHEDVIDPSDPSSIGMVGAPEAEFVGVGRTANWRPRSVRTPRGIAGLVSTGLGRGTVGLGTIFGYPTATDLADLLKAAAYDLQQLQSAQATCVGWPNNPVGWAAWQMDMQDVQASFADASRIAQLSITAAALSGLPALTPVQYEWNLVTSVIRDMTDLDRRLRVNGVCKAPDYPNMPQPSGGDPDLVLFKATDSGTRAIEKFEQKMMSPVGIGTVGVALGILGTLAGLWAINTYIAPVVRLPGRRAR